MLGQHDAQDQPEQQQERGAACPTADADKHGERDVRGSGLRRRRDPRGGERVGPEEHDGDPDEWLREHLHDDRIDQ